MPADKKDNRTLAEKIAGWKHLGTASTGTAAALTAGKSIMTNAAVKKFINDASGYGVPQFQDVKDDKGVFQSRYRILDPVNPTKEKVPRANTNKIPGVQDLTNPALNAAGKPLPLNSPQRAAQTSKFTQDVKPRLAQKMLEDLIKQESRTRASTGLRANLQNVSASLGRGAPASATGGPPRTYKARINNSSGRKSGSYTTTPRRINISAARERFAQYGKGIDEATDLKGLKGVTADFLKNEGRMRLLNTEISPGLTRGLQTAGKIGRGIMWAGAPLTAVADFMSIKEANDFAANELKNRGGGGGGNGQGNTPAPAAYVANPKVENEVIDEFNRLSNRLSDDKSITEDRLQAVFEKQWGAYLEGKGDAYKQTFMQSPRIKKLLDEANKANK
jgi:hypothetical protein